MTFETENSIYEIDEKAGTLTRLNRTGEGLRRDGEPLKIVGGGGNLVIGESAVFMLDLREDGVLTMRVTSPVVRVLS